MNSLPIFLRKSVLVLSALTVSISDRGSTSRCLRRDPHPPRPEGRYDQRGATVSRPDGSEDSKRGKPFSVQKFLEVQDRMADADTQPRVKTTMPFAGMTMLAEAGKPCIGASEATMPPPFPATIGLTQL